MSLPKKQCRVIIKRVNREAIYLHGLFGKIESLEKEAQNLFGGSAGQTVINTDLLVYEESLRQLRLCPYLGLDKKCDIYPVRPINCRIAKTKNRCGIYETEEDITKRPKEIKLFLDQVAINLIIAEQRRMTNDSTQKPLADWPLVEGFKGFFKPDLKEFLPKL